MVAVGPANAMNIHKLFFIYRILNVFGFLAIVDCRLSLSLCVFSFIFFTSESSGCDLCFVLLFVSVYVCLGLFTVQCAWMCVLLLFSAQCQNGSIFFTLSMANDNEPLVNRNYSAFVDNLINDLENETVRIE